MKQAAPATTSFKVFVKNLAIHGFHGVATAERSLGQKFYLDITCDLRPDSASNDEMETTVCYGELCNLAQRISETSEFNLIETLGQQIVEEIMLQFSRVESVRISIRKPSAPIRHIVDHVGIEFSRQR